VIDVVSVVEARDEFSVDLRRIETKHEDLQAPRVFLTCFHHSLISEQSVVCQKLRFSLAEQRFWPFLKLKMSFKDFLTNTALLRQRRGGILKRHD
jgi:hypothetical protein